MWWRQAYHLLKWTSGNHSWKGCKHGNNGESHLSLQVRQHEKITNSPYVTLTLSQDHLKNLIFQGISKSVNPLCTNEPDSWEHWKLKSHNINFTQSSFSCSPTFQPCKYVPKTMQCAISGMAQGVKISHFIGRIHKSTMLFA